MTEALDWWRKPRLITVVVDNDSWILPFARNLVDQACALGDDVSLARDHASVRSGAVAFYLGCVRITPPDVLARNHRNLVVHASDLPRGRGFSPMTWLILEGRNDIPVCLLEAVEQLDAGPIIYRDVLSLEGYELNPEIRKRLGSMHVDICLRFLAESVPPVGTSQKGEATFYSRRRPADSRLDVEKTLAEQFDLLRVVDNDRYPAFFEYRGKRYKLSIDPYSEDKG